LFELESDIQHSNILLKDKEYSDVITENKQIGEKITIVTDNWVEDETYEFNLLNRIVPYIGREFIESDVDFKEILFGMPQFLKLESFELLVSFGETLPENTFNSLEVSIISLEYVVTSEAAPSLRGFNILLSFSNMKVNNIAFQNDIEIESLDFILKFGNVRAVNNYFPDYIEISSLDILFEMITGEIYLLTPIRHVDTLSVNIDVSFSDAEIAEIPEHLEASSLSIEYVLIEAP